MRIKKNGKVINLTESDLKRIVGKVLTEDTESKDFEPHMMYDPETGEEYKAEKPEDHERMSKLGYVHEKPEKVISSLGLNETNHMRRLMKLPLLTEQLDRRQEEEEEKLIIGHIINYGSVSLKIDGYKVNGNILSIFFNPDTPTTTDQKFKLAIGTAKKEKKGISIVLKYNLTDGTISWDFSKLPNFTNQYDNILEARMKKLLGTNLTELDFGDDRDVDPKLKSFIKSKKKDDVTD